MTASNNGERRPLYPWLLTVGAVVSGMIAKAYDMHNWRGFVVVLPLILAAQGQRYIDRWRMEQSGSREARDL